MNAAALIPSLWPLWALLAPPGEAAPAVHVVAVKPASGPGCPAPADVQTALGPLLRPGTLVPFEAPPAGPRLVVTFESMSPTSSRLRVTDAKGGVRLERTLAIAEGEGTKDCAALAETAALIVERYLVELDYQPPPAPPPPPPPPPQPGRWLLSASSAWMPETRWAGSLELGARAGRTLGARRRLLVALGARVAGAWDPVPGGSAYRGQAQQRRFPVELGLWWRTPTRRFDLDGGGGLALDITRTRSEGDPGRVATRTLPGPALWLGVALERAFRGRAFARLAATGHAALVQYDFSHRLDGVPVEVTAFTTPTRRFYARLALDIGLLLP